MSKKSKNIINSSDPVNLSGTEANFKTGSAKDSTDLINSNNYSYLSENKNEPKTSESYRSLSWKLYILILIGLSIAVLLMLAGFGMYFTNSAQNLSLGNLQENALNHADLIYLLKNNQLPASLLISYTGVLTIIFVPMAGLIYIIGYFAYRKHKILALTAAAVLFILILSAAIGLLKT